MLREDQMDHQPSSEEQRQFTSIANKLAWKDPDLNVLNTGQREYPLIATVLQENLKNVYQRGELILPDLRAYGNKSIAVFSDYSGEGPGNYATYSVLVCGLNLVGPFRSSMEKIRQAHGLGDKEIAFKHFGKGQVLRSLPEYLAAFNNQVPGLLVTLAIHKQLRTIFYPQGRAPKDTLVKILRDQNLGSWKSSVAEKLLRVVHLAAFFVGLLAHDGQNIFWMTDHDEIAPNSLQHNNTIALFQSVLELYRRDGFKFPIVGGAVPFAERCVSMLDLLSVTDVVAGSVEQYMTQLDSVGPDNIVGKDGSQHVLRWLAVNGIGTRKLERDLD
jgi:hypothetical protein